MFVSIRSFCEEDYEAVANLQNAVYPDYRTSAKELREQDRRFDESKYVRCRYVAELNETGEIVGFGSIAHNPTKFHPQKFQMDLIVHPNFRRQRIGSNLFAQLIQDLKELNAIAVQATVMETHTEGLNFLRKRGFTEIFRTWELRLDVTGIDLTPFSPTIKKVEEQGIVITTMAEERLHDRNCLRKLYELGCSIRAEIPSPEQFTPVSFEEFKERLNRPNFLPDACFIAKDGDFYIGKSNLLRSLEEPDRLYQGVTGVLPPYRRRGIATALKVHTIGYARQKGYRLIITYNASINEGILALNERLSFKRHIGFITMELALA